ncbi:MAG TPA: F0F1 ATP synthase subunit delta [Nitrospirota bacterium]
MKINITTFIIQLINFALLSYVLQRVLYKPLKAIMEKRKRLVMADIDRALRMKEDAVKMKERYEKLLADIEVARKRELEKAIEEAEETRRVILEGAMREAAAEKEKAAAVIENDRHEMMAALRESSAGISVELATRLLMPLADEALHTKLTDMMLKELEENPPVVCMRNNGDGARAICYSAYKLDGPCNKNFDSILKEFVGASARIEHKVEPELIAGVKLWLDGVVLDGSLRGQLDAFKENALEGTV